MENKIDKMIKMAPKVNAVMNGVKTFTNVKPAKDMNSLVKTAIDDILKEK